MNRYIAIIAIIIFLVAGYFTYEVFIRKPVVIFYVENNSFDRPEVDLKIRIDEKLIADDLFKIDSVAPSFSVYRLQLNKGEHVIDVTSSSLKLNAIDTVEVKQNQYVFISFNYKLKSKFMHQQEKWKFELAYPKEKYPDQIFEFDSVALKPEIKIYVTGEKPILE